MPSAHAAVKHRVAVFWDYESAKVWAEGIKIPLAEKLMNLVAQRGHAKLLRVYGRWAGAETIVQGLYAMGFQPIHAAMGKKNSVDVMLAVDCIASCWEYPDVDLYVLVSGDKDYIPVVNYLKTHEKTVLIVGPTKASSEHLQLSANEFYSFEDLAEREMIPETPSVVAGETVFIPETPSSAPAAEREMIPEAPSSIPTTEHAQAKFRVRYEDAVSCLQRAIATAREEGKPTRFAIIDTLMRADRQCAYTGYSSVEKPGGGSFTSFSDFIRRVKDDKKVVVSSTGVFTEIFLPDENPETDSDYSESSEPILPSYWLEVLESIEVLFRERTTGHPFYARFMMLYNHVRSKKKNGKLPVSNNTIKGMLEEIVRAGLLTRQDDESYRLAEDYKKKKQAFLERKGVQLQK